MAAYFMMGQYSAESTKGISNKRTQDAIQLIKTFDGDVKDMYILLGDKDIVLIVEFPSLDQVVKASVALSKLTGISFSTAPAISVDEFDRIMTEVV
jgi:uncharacterized protein with GYD domain